MHIRNTYGYSFTWIRFEDSLSLFTLNPTGLTCRDQVMSKKPPVKDEALEALDFIVNVLKDHEKDLDKLISELGTVAGKFGDNGELSGKVDNIEQKITGLQNEITSLVNYLSASPREAPLVLKEQSKDEIAKESEVTAPAVISGPPVVLRCKQWEDFQNLAFQ